MTLIDRYGTPIVAYRGVANVSVVESNNNIDSRGYFEVGQFPSGRLAAGFIPTGKPKPTRVELRNGRDAALSFNGDDLDNWSLKTIGDTYISRIPWLLMPLTARPYEFRFGPHCIAALRRGATPSGYTIAYFLISNMFWHPKPTEKPEPIRLDVRDHQVSVTPLDDYQDVAERLTHQHRVEPTAWVCVKTRKNQPKKLSAFGDLMDDLMYLVRLVTGNQVDWYYGEARNASGERAVERLYRHTTPTNYTNTVRFENRRTGYEYLIPKLDLDDLAKSFFDQSGHEFDTKELKLLINHFTTACSDSPFFKSSGLLASTLTDLIVSKRAEANNTSNIISRNKYTSQVLPALKKAIKSLVLSKEDQCSILEHMRGGYRRSFRQKLQEFTNDFDLPLSDCDIELIVRARNALVHRGASQSQAEDGGWRNDYDVMIWTDLIALCRLLGYRGDLPSRRSGQSIVV